MIKTGHWVGEYKYNNEVTQKANGFDKTNFEIEIISVDENRFLGEVEDDVKSGGTEGIGEISGKVSGENIEFVKQMPVLTLMVGKDRTRKTLNRKHRKIYYTGRFSADKKSISGEWKFKFGFIWLGFLPIPAFPTKGTWTMKVKE